MKRKIKPDWKSYAARAAGRDITATDTATIPHRKRRDPLSPGAAARVFPRLDEPMARGTRQLIESITRDIDF